MANMTVIPTRMELTRLKKKLTTARRGHKLLKDKRDGLMKSFLEAVRDLHALREEVEEALDNCHRRFAVASALMGTAAMEQALLCPKQNVSLVVGIRNIMSVSVPVYEIQTESGSDIYPYGFAATSGELDVAVEDLSKVLPKLLRLAETEKSVLLMAEEIERTRRRVNALEYVVIPRTQESIRYITMKLDEQERATVIRLMKVKEMVLKEAVEERRRETERITG